MLTTPRHVPGVLAAVPSWWRVSVAVDRQTVDVVRVGSDNPGPVPFARAQLLWRQEALEHLRALGVARGLSSAPRERLWLRLAEHWDADQMREQVLGTLRRRVGWPARDRGR